MRTLITKLTRKLLFLIRLATWKLRKDPDFIIIGAQKSGTTSLIHQLAKAKIISLPAIKEPEFFSWKPSSYSRYKANFPLKLKCKLTRTLTAEASTTYLYDSETATRIYERYPNIKLIAILREPVDRAYSHYWHMKKQNLENLSFEQAIQVETQRLKKEGKNNQQGTHHKFHSYISRGKYSSQLNKYSKFHNKGNLLVLTTDELNDVSKLLEKICTFLQVPTKQFNKKIVKNTFQYPAALNKTTRTKLNKMFLQEKQKLKKKYEVCFK